ncbi:hypothetical protein OAM07_02455 [Crocinitomicaceae bacterium]|jgi:Leucine-rich repeat (LRR) protein|nr:hypothetical protein [Crocinitomicaceae bacterium]
MKTRITTLLITLFTSSINAQNVNIPDVNFKAYLLGNLAINTNADTEIQTGEAIAFTGPLDCSDQNITDLTGIEAFTSLTYLKCHDNQISSLDISQNTELNELNCHHNLLTSIDVSQNIDLTAFYCQFNSLTSLNLSTNTALTNLFCSNNQLTSLDLWQNSALSILSASHNQIASLDLSQNSALTQLNFRGNQLTTLDVSQNAYLNLLWCYNNELICLNLKNGNNINFLAFQAINNPNLTCIEVDDDVWSTTNWTPTGGNIDEIAAFSMNCNNDCTDFLNLNSIDPPTKKLVKIIDLMGRETLPKKDTLLIYIYTDGSTKQVFESD